MDNIRHHTNNCKDARELIPAYSIGATDQHETQLVEDALTTCPELLDELTDYLALSTALGEVVTGSTDVPAPDTAGLMARIADLEQGDHDAFADDTSPITPIAPEHHRQAESVDESLLFWQNRDQAGETHTAPQPAQHTPEQHHVHREPYSHFQSNTHHQPQFHQPQAHQPQRQPAVPQVQIVKRTGWTAIALTAAAAVIIVLATNAYWFMQFTDLQDEQDQLEIALANLEQQTIDDALNVNLQQVNHRELTPQAENVNARATVLWNSERSIGSLYVTGLPDLDVGMTYQFWLVREGHTLSLGTFEVDENGIGTLIFDAPEQIEDFEAMGISPEPAQGSDTPTAPHVVIGEI